MSDVKVILGIRPDHILGTELDSGLRVGIDVVENLGGIAYAYGKTEAGQAVIVKTVSDAPPKFGTSIAAPLNENYCHLIYCKGQTLSTSAGALRDREQAG